MIAHDENCSFTNNLIDFARCRLAWFIVVDRWVWVKTVRVLVVINHNFAVSNGDALTSKGDYTLDDIFFATS